MRPGVPADAPQLAVLINRAYEAERFFVEGDRTSPDDVLARMSDAVFLVIPAPSGRILGCVLVEVDGIRGSFGMLAVDPGEQGRGWGSRLIGGAEAYAREAGCVTMEIRVVDLRTDLLRLYAKFGYVVAGTEPYVHRPVLRPCHFVVMKKALA